MGIRAYSTRPRPEGSPERMPIPVKNSTQTQNAIWEVTEKRVKGIKDRRAVDISREAAQVMKLPAAQLVQEVKAIAKGLSKITTSEDTLLVYTQCLLDAFRTQIVAQKAQTEEMSQLRGVVARWHRLYRERSVTLIPGSINQGGVQLDYYDLSTLLLGDGYDGWLNGDLIHTPGLVPSPAQAFCTACGEHCHQAYQALPEQAQKACLLGALAGGP
jgi:hypothetical protein